MCERFGKLAKPFHRNVNNKIKKGVIKGFLPEPSGWALPVLDEFVISEFGFRSYSSLLKVGFGAPLRRRAPPTLQAALTEGAGLKPRPHHDLVGPLASRPVAFTIHALL